MSIRIALILAALSVVGPSHPDGSDVAVAFEERVQAQSPLADAPAVAWRVFADPASGLVSDGAAVDNARRLLMASVSQGGGRWEWSRLLGEIVNVESGLNDANRPGWARIVVPIVPEAIEAAADARSREVLGRLRALLPASEAGKRVAAEDLGPLVVPAIEQGNAVRVPTEAVFLAWLGVLSYMQPDLQRQAQSAVYSAILPYLWGTAARLPGDRVREWILAVDSRLQSAGDGERSMWRDWSVRILLQVDRDRPSLVGGVDDAWQPHIEKVRLWLDDKEVKTTFGWTRDTKPGAVRPTPDQTGFLRINRALVQPAGSALPGDHPLVLHLMVDPVRAALGGGPDANSQAAWMYLQWLVDERAILGPDSAATVLGFLVRLYQLSPEWFEVDPGRRDCWKSDLTGYALFVRSAFEKVVARFNEGRPDSLSWHNRLDVSFLKNPVLAGGAIEALRAAGRVQLLTKWKTLASGVAPRAEGAGKADVPSVSLEEAIAGLKAPQIAEMEAFAKEAVAGAEQARAIEPILQNDWSQPWLITVPGDLPTFTLEEWVRWAGWCRKMTPESVRLIIERLWPEQFAAARSLEWTRRGTFPSLAILRDLPWGQPDYRTLLDATIAEALVQLEAHPEGPPAAPTIATIAFVCWVGVPNTEGGLKLIKALGERRDDRLFKACRLYQFAAACRRPALELARPDLPVRDLTSVIEGLAPVGGDIRPDAFEMTAIADALHTLVSMGDEPLDAWLSQGLRAQVAAALQPRVEMLMGTSKLIREHLTFLTDAACIGRWLQPTATALAASLIEQEGVRSAMPEGSKVGLGRSSPETIEACATLLVQVRAEGRFGLLLSIDRASSDPTAHELLRVLRRHVGGLCASVAGGHGAKMPVLYRADVQGPLRGLPESAREPWWDLGGWYRLAYQIDEDNRPRPTAWQDHFPEVARLVRVATEAERGLFPEPANPYRAEGESLSSPRDIDGVSSQALPPRPFAVVREALGDRIKALNELQEKLKKEESERKADGTLKELIATIQDGQRFDMMAARPRFEAAVHDLRAAENLMDARRHFSLAAEAELAGAKLFAEAATLKAKQAEFDVTVALNKVRMAKIDQDIAPINKKIADGGVLTAEEKVKLEKLEGEKTEIRRKLNADAIAVIQNEITLVKAALFDKKEATNSESQQVIVCQGYIGALAQQAEWQIHKYQDRLHKTKAEYQGRLKKLREGNCITAVTRVLGSLVSLIPGAGPFIGIGIIAMGEVTSGIHTGKSVGDIFIGLGDNVLDLSRQFGVDIEQGLNKLGEKAGVEFDKLFGGIEERLKPLLKQLPTFLDKDVVRTALDATGLTGPARDLIIDLKDVLSAGREDAQKLGKVGTLVVAVGREAAVRGQTSQEMFDNLKSKIDQEFRSGRLKTRLDKMRKDEELLGLQVGEIMDNPDKFVPGLASKFASLVLAESGRGMVEHRNRLLGRLSIAMSQLQAKLGTTAKEFATLEQLVAAEFLKEFQADPALKSVLEDILQGLPEEAKILQREGEHYRRIGWEGILEKVAQNYLSQLIPMETEAQATFLGKLRLCVDPAFAAERLGLIVRPWQAALQARLKGVEEDLDAKLPLGGDEKQQLDASIAQIDKGIKKLDGVLQWLKDENSDERNQLKSQLGQLKTDLENREGNAEIEKLNAKQAEIRIAIATTEVNIARDQAVISRYTQQKTEINLTNADLSAQREALGKQIKNLEKNALGHISEATEEKFQGRRSEYMAAEAVVAKLKQNVRGARAELDVADEWLKRVAPDPPPIDVNLRNLRTAYDRELDKACALVRELLRLSRWVGPSVANRSLPRGDRQGQINTLRDVAEAIDNAWDSHEFSSAWIQEIDLDGRTIEGSDQIRRLFSTAGTTLRVVPGIDLNQSTSGAVSLGRAGIVKIHRYDPNARIAAVVLVAARITGQAKGNDGRAVPTYTVLTQGGWRKEFTWLGSEYLWTKEGVRAASYPDRLGRREAPVLSGLEGNFHPFTDDAREEGWDRLSALSREGLELEKAGFVPPVENRPGTDGLPVFFRLTDAKYLQPLLTLDDIVLKHYALEKGFGMGRLTRSPVFRRWLGPPLFGEHFLRVGAGFNFAPAAPGERLPIDHVRICILYLHDKSGPLPPFPTGGQNGPDAAGTD